MVRYISVNQTASALHKLIQFLVSVFLVLFCQVIFLSLFVKQCSRSVHCWQLNSDLVSPTNMHL